jgi:hypothetical protein
MLQTEPEFSLLGVSCNLSGGVGNEDEAETIQRRRESCDLTQAFIGGSSSLGSV